MKKYINDMLHEFESFNAWITQLGIWTCKLENFIDYVKIFVGNSHGSTNEEIRLM